MVNCNLMPSSSISFYQYRNEKYEKKEIKQVRISSIEPDSPNYDITNSERYLGSRRYLGQDDPQILSLKKIFLPATLK